MGIRILTNRIWKRTGMFLPKKIERRFSPEGVMGKIALFVLIASFTIGGAFALRNYTVKHLPLWTSPNVVALALLSDESLHNVIHGHEINKILLVIFHSRLHLLHREDIIHSVFHLLRVIRKKRECNYVWTCPEGKMFTV